MPFWRTYYHLVWATKDRAELIGPEVEETLFRYLVNKAAELNVRVYAINGWFDHVHMVVGIPPKHSIATVVKRLRCRARACAWPRTGNDGLFQSGEGLLADRAKAVAPII